MSRPLHGYDKGRPSCGVAYERTPAGDNMILPGAETNCIDCMKIRVRDLKSSLPRIHWEIEKLTAKIERAGE